MNDSQTPSYSFEQLSPPLFPLAKKFYKRTKYHSHIGREDEVYVAREQSTEDPASDKEIVAAVRLVRLDRFLILRSMVVSPNRQRKGIGRFLLEHLAPAIGERDCWCFPFEWLEEFYSLVQFKKLSPDLCPPAIAHKYQQYTSQGRKLLIMSRLSS